MSPKPPLNFNSGWANPREQVGATEFETIRAEGRLLSVDDALNLALAQR
jgi:hypothetical protein